MLAFEKSSDWAIPWRLVEADRHQLRNRTIGEMNGNFIFFLSVIWNKNFVEEIECHILAAYLSDCDVLSGRFIHDSERLLPLGQEWAKGYGSIFRTIKLFLLVMNAVTNFLVDDQRLGIYFTCAQVTQSGYNNDDLLRSFESMQIDQCFQVY